MRVRVFCVFCVFYVNFAVPFFWLMIEDNYVLMVAIPKALSFLLC